ncbi:hypothetical protein D3C76_1703370 [compost metagenome]
MDKYLSPVSGSSTTIVLPIFSVRLAISVAAHNAAPEDIPVINPSVLHKSLPVLNASSFLTFIISLYICIFKVSGINPAPIP